MAPVLFSIILFATVTHTVSSLSILPSDTFEVGSTITVTCSVVSMDVPTEFEIIAIVKMLYRPYSSTDPNPKIIAFLSASNYGQPLNLLWKNMTIPPGKDWDIEFPTEAEMEVSRFQRGTMVIKAVLKKVSCDDSGYYSCEVIDPSTNMKMESQSMNATVSPSNLIMAVVPDNALDKALQATYESNETITVTCRADGLTDTNFFWSRRCPTRSNSNPSFVPDPIFQQWPVSNQIGQHTKQSIPNDKCDTMRHSQTLTFMMNKDLSECMVRCQFGPTQTSQSTLQANFTFLLEGDTITTDPPTGGSTSSASNKDLVIGLTVSLLLLAIIVAAVLIYVCWWRKRKPQDKYKDEPDVGHDNNGSHAPPPVFYSKPHKQPSKDDARGDKLRQSEDSDNAYDSDLPPKAHYDNEGKESDYAPRQKYSSSRPRSARRSDRGSGDYYNYDNEYNPEKSRHRSSGDGPYASTDISRSEDESADQSESGRSRPKPKRRTKLPPQEEDENDALHYAELDLKQKDKDTEGEHRGRYNRNRRNRRSRGQSQDDEEEQPVQYASIRV